MDKPLVEIDLSSLVELRPDQRTGLERRLVQIMSVYPTVSYRTNYGGLLGPAHVAARGSQLETHLRGIYLASKEVLTLLREHR
jgi:hypothetical protein